MRPVLLIGPYPPPYGGPGVHMVHLQRQLGMLGVPCQVLNIGPRRQDVVPGVIPVRSGVDFLVSVVRSARRGYHTHHFFNLESHKAILLAAAAAVVSRLCGGTYSVAFIGGPNQKYLVQPGWFWRRLCRIPLRAAQFVICNNLAVKAELLTFGPSPSAVHPIECFHDSQIARIGRRPCHVRTFMEAHHPLLSTVTHPRLETDAPHHEMEILIGALASVRQVHPDLGCVVVGGADATEHYHQLAREAGIERLFCFAGELTHEDCLAVMKDSDIFVRTYRKDGSSSSVREALALGVPTVASANPQHPEAVVPFAPNDPGSLAATLVDVLTEIGEVRQRLAEAPPPPARPMDHELGLLLQRARATAT